MLKIYKERTTITYNKNDKGKISKSGGTYSIKINNNNQYSKKIEKGKISKSLKGTNWTINRGKKHKNVYTPLPL